MRAKLYRMKLAMEYGQLLIQGIQLKLKYPLWHDADENIAKIASFLRHLKTGYFGG